MNYTLNKADFWWEGISIVIYGSSSSDFFFFQKKNVHHIWRISDQNKLAERNTSLKKNFNGLLIQCKQNEACKQKFELKIYFLSIVNKTNLGKQCDWNCEHAVLKCDNYMTMVRRVGCCSLILFKVCC